MYLYHEIKGSGPTIVFLHGAFVNSEIWQHQAAYFARDYQVINIDMRGHGHSDGSKLNEYSVSIFAEDVIRLLDSYNIKSALFFGLSLGSMVTQHIAFCYPERVRGIVLVGATVSMKLFWVEKIVTTVLFPKWVAMWLFNKLSTKQFMKLSFFLTWFMRGNRWLGSTATRETIRNSISMVDRNELKKIYAAVHGFRQQNLLESTFPVLLINGSFDSQVIHRHSKHMLKLLGSRAKLIVIQNGGHACNYDQPLLFNNHVEDWMHQKDFFADNSETKIMVVGS